MEKVVKSLKRLLGDADETAKAAAKAPVRRTEPRARPRFCSGKVLDARNKFLCDCVIIDRSSTGLGIRLARDIRVDEQFCLHDDQTHEILEVVVAWRRGVDLGVRILHRNGIVFVKPAIRNALKRQYYAVPD